MGKSKYDRVFPTLKRVPVDDIDYQQKTDVVKQEIVGPRPEGFKPVPDEVIHELITDALEGIADEVKIICQAIVNAPNGRHYASVFGRYYLELRRAEDYIDGQLKNVRLLLNAFEQLGVAQFEVEGTENIKFDDLGRVKTQPEIVAKVRDKDALRDWYVEAGLFRELNPHHGAMQSLAKTRLLQSMEGNLPKVDEHGQVVFDDEGNPVPEDPAIPGVETYFNIKFTK